MTVCGKERDTFGESEREIFGERERYLERDVSRGVSLWVEQSGPPIITTAGCVGGCVGESVCFMSK